MSTVITCMLDAHGKLRANCAYSFKKNFNLNL